MTRLPLSPSNPRASFAAWTRFAPFVLAAFRQHPKPYVFIPENFTPNSVCSKIRDAIRGALEFEYPCDVPIADLRHWYSEVVVRYTATEVIIGPRTSPLEPIRTKASGYTYATLSLDELNAFCVLLSSGRLDGPVTILSPPIGFGAFPLPPSVQSLQKPDGSLILL